MLCTADGTNRKVLELHAEILMPKPKDKPVHEIRLGPIKAALWKHDTTHGPRYNVRFARLYFDQGRWQSSGSFGRDDLLLLAKVADHAHSWICQQVQETAPAGHAAGTSESP